MSEIQTKDKLITLEELGAAIDAKAGVTSVNNQTGAVSLTPVNIGAVAKTGGDTMTGSLVIDNGWLRINYGDIVQNAGYIRGEPETAEGYVNHGIKLGHSGEDHMQFLEYEGKFTFYQAQSGTYTPLFQIANGVSGTPLRVNNGGTGATTPEGACANIGAMGSTVKHIDFGSSASAFYANLNTELSSMSGDETKFLRFQPDVADGNFHAYHIFTGYITKLTSSIAMGMFCSHYGDVIYLYCDSGSWNSKLLT